MTSSSSYARAVHTSPSILMQPTPSLFAIRSSTIACLPTRAAVPVRIWGGVRTCRSAIGRRNRSVSSEAATNTIHDAMPPAPTASTTAAIAAPSANGARKKPVVSISPTPNAQAAITHRIHPDMLLVASLPRRDNGVLAISRVRRLTLCTAGAAMLVLGAARASQRSPTIMLSRPLPSVIRVDQLLTVSGEAKHAAGGTSVALEVKRAGAWNVVSHEIVPASERFKLRWRVTGPAYRRVWLRVAALSAERTVATTAAQQATVGPRAVYCAPATPPKSVPEGDGLDRGRRVRRGRCLSRRVRLLERALHRHRGEPRRRRRRQ